MDEFPRYLHTLHTLQVVEKELHEARVNLQSGKLSAATDQFAHVHGLIIDVLDYLEKGDG